MKTITVLIWVFLLAINPEVQTDGCAVTIQLNSGKTEILSNFNSGIMGKGKIKLIEYNGSSNIITINFVDTLYLDHLEPFKTRLTLTPKQGDQIEGIYNGNSPFITGQGPNGDLKISFSEIEYITFKCK